MSNLKINKDKISIDQIRVDEENDERGKQYQ